MKLVAVDSSVMVAALLSWHESHRAAFRALDRLLQARSAVIPVPALLGSYAVMTGLPSPHRISPADAAALLKESFSDLPLIGFPTREIWRILDDYAGQGVGGPSTFDAVVLEAARQANAGSILTLNRDRFERLDLGEMDLIVPGER